MIAVLAHHHRLYPGNQLGGAPLRYFLDILPKRETIASAGVASRGWYLTMACGIKKLTHLKRCEHDIHVGCLRAIVEFPVLITHRYTIGSSNPQRYLSEIITPCICTYFAPVTFGPSWVIDIPDDVAIERHRRNKTLSSTSKPLKGASSGYCTEAVEGQGRRRGNHSTASVLRCVRTEGEWNRESRSHQHKRKFMAGSYHQDTCG